MVIRTLASAALAASVLAADVVLLALFLNPDAQPARDGLALLLVLFLPYAVVGTLAFFALALVGGAVRGWPKVPRPLIEGLPWLTSLMLLALVLASALFWLNVVSYRHSVPVPFLRALAGAAVGLTTAALVLVAVGVDAVLFPLRGRAVSAAIVVLACASAVVVPLALRPPHAPPPHPVPVATETVQPARRVILVGLDGIGPEQLREGIASGSLPACARIVKRGAHGPLATLRPTEGPPIWTTIVTGQLPRDHGVKSFATYRLRGSDTVFELLPKGAFVRLLERAGLVSTSPVTSNSRRRRALWNALNAFGISTGLVRIWGTHPTERVQGFMLSHYFHVLRHQPTGAAATLHPPDLLAEVSARAVDADDVDRALLSQFLDTPAEGDASGRLRRDLVERALAPDVTYHRAGDVLRAAYDPAFFATYYYGLDVVGHGFLRFAQPDRFGDVTPPDVRRYGPVLERYAALLDGWIGEAAQALRPGDVLLVVSGYGMEPVPLWRRALGGLVGESGPSGSHSGAPDGFLLAIGDGVRPGAVIRGASVLDVAPTILYLMGLPVARDMGGRVLTEVLEDEFAWSHPLTFIPSYESLDVTPMAGGPGPELPPLPEEGP
jgi:predicted AlkP superfamily phosphohydrolase/phosphomutase